MAKNQALDYSEQLFDFKLVRYYHYNIEMIPIMGLAIIKILRRLVKKIKKRANRLFGSSFGIKTNAEKMSKKTPKIGKSIQK